jgi:microsomal dipeptidase-like Zn-dependent dipeptidase
LGRDLLERHDYAHLDLPRMVEGNLAIQGFAVPTKAPKDLIYGREDVHADSKDLIDLLADTADWPAATRESTFARAVYMASRFHDLHIRSLGSFRPILTRRDLDRFLADRRQEGPGLTAGFLCLEGAHALEGKLENLDHLYDVGYRLIGLAHFFDTDVGGSAHGVERGGLTELGRAVIRRMGEKRMILDLAHSSPQTFDDALEFLERLERAGRPRPGVCVSHTGVVATYANERNIRDEDVDRIIRLDGVVGIGLFPYALGDDTLEAFLAAVRHVADRENGRGIHHVALGSDFDGICETIVDASGLALVTEALLSDPRFDRRDVGRVMGENLVRLLRTWLPP